MNKLKTDYNGGWPLELDDIDFAIAGISESFYGFLSAFGIAPEDSFIISGCARNTPNYDPGFISLNGEILKVVGAVIPALGAGEVLYWDLDITYDSAGREQLENSSTVDTYQLRRAVLKNAVLTPGTYMPFETNTLSELIASIAIDRIPVVADVDHFVDGVASLGTSFQGSPPWANDGSGNRDVKFFKDINGIVHLSGCATVHNGSLIFQLPTGYRPAFDDIFICPKRAASIAPNFVRVVVDTDGTVTAFPDSTYANAETISLAGISFRAAS